MKIKKLTGISDPGYFLLLAVNFSAYKVVYYSLVFVCIVSLVNKPLSLSLSENTRKQENPVGEEDRERKQP